MSDGEDRDATLIADWTAVVRAVESVQNSFAQRLDVLGMSLPYFAVLSLLLDATDHRLPMSRIARDLAMTSGGFTKLADRMARDGLIDRRGSAGDRRVVFAALTDAGLGNARRAVEAYRDFLRREVIEAVDGRDLERLAALSRTLNERHRPRDAEVPPFEITPRTPEAPDRRTRRRD